MDKSTYIFSIKSIMYICTKEPQIFGIDAALQFSSGPFFAMSLTYVQVAEVQKRETSRRGGVKMKHDTVSADDCS